MKLLVVVMLCFLALPAFAVQNDRIFPQYLGVRAIGAGDAFTAVGDDYETLMYNAAGLARLTEGQINFGVRGAMTTTALQTYQSLKDSMGTKDPVQVETAINNNLGKHEATRVGIDAFWVRPHWGIALIPVDSSIDIDLRGGGPTVGITGIQDSTLIFGYAMNFGENDSLSIGLAAKGVYRAYYDKDLSAVDLATSGSSDIVKLSDAKEGLAIDGDFGTIYTVQVPNSGFFSFLKYARPTFGLAVRNIADAGYSSNFHLFGKATGDNPAKLERRFDFGSKWELPEFWIFKPRLMVDGRDMGTRYASFKKCLHAGAELLWRVGRFLNGGYRVGVSQGYLTAGVSAKLLIFNLDAATYSEEIGTSDSPRENRRYILKASFDF